MTTLLHRLPCECLYPGCPHCAGKHGVKREVFATQLQFRIDREDRTGTALCDLCAADALASGMYYTGTLPQRYGRHK